MEFEIDVTLTELVGLILMVALIVWLLTHLDWLD